MQKYFFKLSTLDIRSDLIKINRVIKTILIFFCTKRLKAFHKNIQTEGLNQVSPNSNEGTLNCRETTPALDSNGVAHYNVKIQVVNKVYCEILEYPMTDSILHVICTKRV